MENEDSKGNAGKVNAVGKGNSAGSTTGRESMDTVDSMELAHLFRRTSRLMARAYHRRDRARHAQDHVLDIIRGQEAMTQAELLETLDVRSSSLSELLRKLELAGLITRERNPEDRRGFVVSATEEGRKAGQGRDEGEAEASDPFACLDEEERDQLRTLLTKLAKALQEDSPGGGKGCCPGRGSGRGGRGRGPGKMGPRGNGPGRKGRGRRGGGRGRM